MKQSGRTTKMLLEALEMHGNAAQMPVLIYGINQNHIQHMMNLFINLAKKQFDVQLKNKNTIEVDNDCMYEFRSLVENDSPLGIRYSHIFIDHYCLES